MMSNLRLEIGMVRTVVKNEMEDKFPGKAGLKHGEPTAKDVMYFFDRMLTCTRRELDKKWFKHLVPYLVVLCGDDFARDFGPNGRLTLTRWVCLGRMITYKEGRMYGSWQMRWRHIFDVRFVLALMYNSYSLNFDYMNTMMSFEVLGYRLEWTKKLMLPVPYMNSWSLYVVDVEEKTLLVMDPCETFKDEDDMKLKHKDNANIILEGLRRCFHANIAGWYVRSQGWKVL